MSQTVKQKYYTPLDPPPCEDHLVYSNIQPVMKWNKERTALVKVGEHDVDKEISASAVGITVYDLLRRVQSGEVGALNREECFYDDVSGDPETLAEQKAVVEAADQVKDYLGKEAAAKEAVAKEAAAKSADDPAKAGEDKK